MSPAGDGQQLMDTPGVTQDLLIWDPLGQPGTDSTVFCLKCYTHFNWSYTHQLNLKRPFILKYNTSVLYKIQVVKTTPGVPCCRKGSCEPTNTTSGPRHRLSFNSSRKKHQMKTPCVFSCHNFLSTMEELSH